MRVAGILGDYHKTAPIETFTASSIERHPTDLAGLRGARLVTATETEEGRRWAESAHQGADRRRSDLGPLHAAGFLRVRAAVQAGDRRQPQARNCAQSTRQSGAASTSCPFTVTIPPKERDPDLAEKLRVEWPGILQWMIAGCADWQRHGLAPPEIVTAATAAYLEAEDAMSAWIDDRCQRDPNAWASSSDLFLSWKGWADAVRRVRRHDAALLPDTRSPRLRSTSARRTARLRWPSCDRSSGHGWR